VFGVPLVVIVESAAIFFESGLEVVGAVCEVGRVLALRVGYHLHCAVRGDR